MNAHTQRLENPHLRSEMWGTLFFTHLFVTHVVFTHLFFTRFFFTHLFFTRFHVGAPCLASETWDGRCSGEQP